MLRKATLIWIVGLVTVVPYAGYYLFFHASREQYAVLITLVLFWIFGYWGVVGPLLALIKVRSVLRAIEQAKSRDDLVRTLQSAEARDIAIEHIATENHIPRFLATRVYEVLASRLSARIDR
jgi:hypothetical protein